MASMLIGFGMPVAVGMTVGVEFGESDVDVDVVFGVNVDRIGVSVTDCGVVIPQDESATEKAITAKNIFCIALFLLSQFYQFHLNFK